MRKFTHVLMMGVVGNAIKCQKFSTIENSKHLLLCILETRNGRLSFEVGRQRIKRMLTLFYGKKQFYEVLFSSGRLIIVFCWEKFWLGYGKDLIQHGKSLNTLPRTHLKVY